MLVCGFWVVKTLWGKTVMIDGGEKSGLNYGKFWETNCLINQDFQIPAPFTKRNALSSSGGWEKDGIVVCPLVDWNNPKNISEEWELFAIVLSPTWNSKLYSLILPSSRHPSN